MGFFGKIAYFFSTLFGGSRKHMKTGAELMKEYPLASAQSSTSQKRMVASEPRMDEPILKDEPRIDEPSTAAVEEQVVADDFDDYKKSLEVGTEPEESSEYESGYNDSSDYDPVQDAYNPFSQETLEKAGTDDDLKDEDEDGEEVVTDQDTGPQPIVKPFSVESEDVKEEAAAEEELSFKDFGAMKQMLRQQNAAEDATRMISLEEIQAEEHVKKSPLHKAIEQQNIKVAKILIDKGAYINDQDSDGLTPMAYAVQANLHEIIELLREQGAE